MQANRLTLLIAEDEYTILRNLVSKISEFSQQYEIIGTAVNGMEALDIIKEKKPDILLTDIRMPRMNGLELIELAARINPEMASIILSGYSDFTYARSAVHLQVTEYLLKPVDSVQLFDALSRLRGKILKNKTHLNRNILYSEQSGDFFQSLPSAYDQDSFYLYHITLGNLYRAAFAAEIESICDKYWHALDWDKILPMIHQTIGNWWLIDECMSNQKFLLFLDHDHQQSSQDLSELLSHEIKIIHPDLPVTICYAKGIMKREEFSYYSKKLRTMADSHVIPGTSQCLCYHDAPYASNDLITFYIRSRMNQALEAMDFNTFKSLLKGQIKLWENLPATQRDLEKAVDDIFILMKKANLFLCPGSNLYDLKNQLAVIISSENKPGTLYRQLYTLLIQALEPDNVQDLKPEQQAEEIRKYIQDNYHGNISLEGIAEHYGYSQTYLSKIFKKFFGESPIKYIIHLKIDEAKRLILDMSQMDFKAIAESLGYMDQQYFCRIFKSVTGVTPTEFRSGVNKEE